MNRERTIGIEKVEEKESFEERVQWRGNLRKVKSQETYRARETGLQCMYVHRTYADISFFSSFAQSFLGKTLLEKTFLQFHNFFRAALGDELELTLVTTGFQKGKLFA